MAVHKAGAVLGTHAQSAADGVIYRQLMQQAGLLAYTDAFFLSAVIMCCVIPLVIFLKRPLHSEPVSLH
jgi:hypothetical protein